MAPPPPDITISVSVNGFCFDYSLIAVVMLSCVNIFTIRQAYRKIKQIFVLKTLGHVAELDTKKQN